MAPIRVAGISSLFHGRARAVALGFCAIGGDLRARPRFPVPPICEFVTA